MAISIRKLSISLAWIATLAAWVPGAAQQVPDVPDVEILKSLPIDLDATSSEFDRKKNRLIFRDLRIRQGPLQHRCR